MGCTFLAPKSWRPFLVVTIKTQAKSTKLTTSTSRSPQFPLSSLSLGALTTFPCKFGPNFFSPPWGCTRSPTALLPDGYAYGSISYWWLSITCESHFRYYDVLLPIFASGAQCIFNDTRANFVLETTARVCLILLSERMCDKLKRLTWQTRYRVAVALQEHRLPWYSGINNTSLQYGATVCGNGPSALYATVYVTHECVIRQLGLYFTYCLCSVVKAHSAKEMQSHRGRNRIPSLCTVNSTLGILLERTCGFKWAVRSKTRSAQVASQLLVYLWTVRDIWYYYTFIWGFQECHLLHVA